MALPSRRWTAWSHLWAFSPLFSFGVITPLAFGVVAAQHRSRQLVVATVFYVVVALIEFGVGTQAGGSTGRVILTCCLLISMLGATVHALILRNRFHPSTLTPLGQAIDEVKERRRLREEAVQIVRTDPQLAVELNIGRPDLARSYDDGGLVDFNHAPIYALLAVPGLALETAESIIRVREQVGGFSSAEEVSALAQLPPQLTPHLSRYAIFLP